MPVIRTRALPVSSAHPNARRGTPKRSLLLGLAVIGILPAWSSAADAQAQCAPAPSVPVVVPVTKADSTFEAKVAGIHKRVLTMDTHVDIVTGNFRTDTVNYAKCLRTQVDLVKMAEGGLDAIFMAVYVGQPAANAQQDSAGFARAHAQAIEKFQAIQRLADTIAPTKVGYAKSAADARRIYASGRMVVFAGIENGYPVGADITNVKKFHDLGGRYMSLAHNNHSQLSDSNTGERDNVWRWNGLSPLGRQVIAEMNRVGMMIDVSHPSKASMMETLKLSKAPIMASHSGVRALCNHSRNMDDEQLKALKANGGVIQLVAFQTYVKCDPAKDSVRTANREVAMTALRAKYNITAPAGRGGGGGGGGGGRGGRGAAPSPMQLQIDSLPLDKKNAYIAEQEDIMNRRYPSDPAANVEDFANHIDYAVKLIGIDHVGISSDFDGGGGVDGWRNAAETINVTRELVKRGYTEAQIAKIWSGNLLRVLEQVEAAAKKIKAGTL
ncbi:MAG: membrane dipeptidase [Phycisphaerae bacterium]|nr:membrane dipeptidase [Gemmatimonadaceae bacterium]